MFTSFAERWSLDPRVTFLNHGSFGATPTEALRAQRGWQDRMERDPIQFFLRDLEQLGDAALQHIAPYLGADPNDLGFVTNATDGVNTVLRSLRFEPGDELLTTDHAYNACAQALRYVAELHGATVTTARVPFPCPNEDSVFDAVMAAVTDKTKLVLIDHITSPTALLFPVQRIAAACRSRGVRVLIDGAHAPGQVAVDVSALGADYYIANCHKWLCAPKGVGLLWVRRDQQQFIRPLAISHGANSPRVDRSRFRLEFGWTGTADPSPMLCVATSVGVLESSLGSLEAVMARNHSLVVAARALLRAALGEDTSPVGCPEGMLGSMATLLLPERVTRHFDPTAPSGPVQVNPLQQRLFEACGVEVPVFSWHDGRWLLRVSAQLYNSLEHYERLAQGLQKIADEGAR